MATNTSLYGLFRVITATAYHLQQTLTALFGLRISTSEKPIAELSLESRQPPAGEGDPAFGILGGTQGCASSRGQETNTSVSIITYRCASALIRLSRDG